MTELKNVPASINNRLQNIAKAQDVPFQKTLQYYGFERFLFRLSRSEYADKFVLKGGLIFYALGLPAGRLTKDIDLRGFTNNSFENLSRIVIDIFRIPAPYDGLLLDEETLKLEEITTDADYHGVRISFELRLGKVIIPLKMDIGFSDVITPGIVEIEYQVLLKEMKPPILKRYSFESIVAEKFHALVKLSEINSRWKDYYDIWLLSEKFDFSGKLLQQAIQSTFSKRDTLLPNSTPIGLTDEFALSRQPNWQVFLKNNRISQDGIENFTDVVSRLRNFLLPPIEIIHTQSFFSKDWIAGTDWK